MSVEVSFLCVCIGGYTAQRFVVAPQLRKICSDMKNQQIIWAVLITIITLITAWNFFQLSLHFRDAEETTPTETTTITNEVAV